MKTVILIIRQNEISKVFLAGLRLQLDDTANVLDAIRVADKKIQESCGEFPVKQFQSLLQMVYHPRENRFYKQVAIQAHSAQSQFLNVREEPLTPLPDGTAVVLIPQGGCSTDWEEPVQ